MRVSRRWFFWWEPSAENEWSENCWQTILKRISGKDKINFSNSKAFQKHLHKSKTKKNTEESKEKKIYTNMSCRGTYTKTVNRMFKSIKRKSYDWNEQKACKLNANYKSNLKGKLTHALFILLNSHTHTLKRGCVFFLCAI